MRTRYTVALSMLAGAVIGAAAIQGLNAQAKPKAYTISELETLDPAGAIAFTKTIAPVQQAAGGHNLRTAGGKVVGLEGGGIPNRVAITEWDSLDHALAFYKSKEWNDLAAQRDKVVKTIRRYVVEVLN